ncbi:hypothetical protein LWI29_033991 [Acer saccharum]|uniref:Uncharacterized protein n=1 Tax=Acer saccharum TaxID=4024 RepID=A0AA39RF29_ACESA|nr:hypothetical protein LWI29_033991 [Acer saccharum]
MAVEEIHSSREFASDCIDSSEEITSDCVDSLDDGPGFLDPLPANSPIPSPPSGASVDTLSRSLLPASTWRSPIQVQRQASSVATVSGTHLGGQRLVVPVEARGHHGEAERPSSRGGHTPQQESSQVSPSHFGSFPLVPLTLFDRLLVSKLGIQIRFQITNYNSLTHEDDYKTLTIGSELDSIYEDEDNALLRNVKLRNFLV